jgi:DNA-binding SARP family transcriptional activator
MGLLDAAGDRAEALRAYEDFKVRVARDLEVSPSTSSRRLARDMRDRTTPTTPDPRRSGSSP